MVFSLQHYQHMQTQGSMVSKTFAASTVFSIYEVDFS